MPSMHCCEAVLLVVIDDLVVGLGPVLASHLLFHDSKHCESIDWLASQVLAT